MSLSKVLNKSAPPAGKLPGVVLVNQIGLYNERDGWGL